MKAVITLFVQKELGVATFKVDQEVRKLVEAGRKFIMEPVPRELIEHMDDGLVVSEQTMATNEALQPFFNSDELFRRIGGIDSLVAWLRRKEGQVRLGHVVLAGQQAYHESTGNGMGNPW